MGILQLPREMHPDFAKKGFAPKGNVKVKNSNRLALSMEALWHADTGSFDFLSPNGILPAQVTGGSVEYKPNPRGKALTATASSTSVTTDNNVNVPGTGDYTFFCHVYIDAITSAFNYLIALDSSVGIACHSGDDFYFFHGATLRSNFMFEVGKVYTVVGVRRGNTAYIYVDGVLQASAATSSNITARKLRLLSYNGAFSFSGERNVLLAGYSTRGWSEAEILSFQQDPYQMLEPVVPQMAFIPDATGGQNLSPTGIASAESFGTGVITTGAVVLTPTGIASTEAFGTATVTDTQSITPSGIVSEEAFGTAVLTTGAVNLSPSGIASTEAFGTADVSQATFITPTGIASAEAFGTAVITTGAVTLTPTGISSEEAFGSHTVAVAGDKDIKIDFDNELVLTSNLQSATIYYNGTDYFTIN